MDRPGDSQKPPTKVVPDPQRRSRPATGPKALYLIAYNVISAGLWFVVLGRVLLVASVHGYQDVYTGVGEWTKWTQTVAGLEVLHAIFGIVRAPIMTTVMQVASRFLLVWGIVHPFPAETAAVSPAYSTMLLAWSVTEVIRYSYFATNLAFGQVPGWLLWFRYNTFFVLYPLGIGSECWLVWLAAEPAGRAFGPVATWALYGVLGVYVPGSYVLFTHMMAQRKKVLRGEAAKKKGQ